LKKMKIISVRSTPFVIEGICIYITIILKSKKLNINKNRLSITNKMSSNFL
jgi:hypothetical protein